MVKLLGTYEVPPEAKEEHDRFLVADAAYNKAWRDLDKFKEGTDKWLNQLNVVIAKAQREMFRAFDAFNYKCQHKDDKVTALESDIRAIVVDSLSDKLDELEFTINAGLVASKVAQAIRILVIDGDMGVPPLCGDCS